MYEYIYIYIYMSADTNVHLRSVRKTKADVSLNVE